MYVLTPVKVLENLFTFQSGYIQIKSIPSSSDEFLALHSNLVIFKYIPRTAIVDLKVTLHSNLVIFKYLCIPYAQTYQDSLHSNLVIFKLTSATL